jgi:hypothetical protein
MIKYILLFVYYIYISTLYAQSRPPAFAQKVYDDLYNNLNATKQISKPKLRYFAENKKMVVDYYCANEGLDAEIQIGAEFINVIRSFGADSSNALAFVLGHEMAHIFLEQTNIYKVGSGYANNQLMKKYNYLSKDTVYSAILESQADEQAIFYAHLGGYKVTHLAEEVLKRIYSHFKLNPKLRGYPMLEDRIKIARLSAVKMNALLERFEIANLSFVAGKYEISQKIYSAIINEGFKSAEIYNNLGLCYLMQVIESDTIFQKYFWPVFLDSRTKLQSTSERDFGGIDVQEFLNQAILNFENSNRFRGYKYSQLNLSIAHLIYLISGENDGSDHLEEANSALNKFKTLNLPQYSTMNAIILHYIGDNEIAKNEFLLSAENNPISKRNLEMLYFSNSQAKSIQNPLSKILFSSLNMFDLFMNRTDIIADTSTKYLNSFANTVLDKKYYNSIEIQRYNSKSLGKKIYFATYVDGYEELTETQLISFADEILYTNLYRYYTFNEWVVRYDASNVKTVFLITEF